MPPPKRPSDVTIPRVEYVDEGVAADVMFGEVGYDSELMIGALLFALKLLKMIIYSHRACERNDCSMLSSRILL